MSGAPQDVARRLREGMAAGVLSFPLTAFHEDGLTDPTAADLAALKDLLAAGLGLVGAAL
ncbi:hypothetical protein ACFV19_17170 [Streptomyces griseoluteus]|uniref:hypothetical protein n=1 Tax=Streptomyces griseoluteus TaxID=29306 RepID=UPI0036C451D2